jgi:two-component system cell cycle sensor histidine kinase/response regulator CckA
VTSSTRHGAADDAYSSPTVLLLDDDGGTLLVLHTILNSTSVEVIECEDEVCAIDSCRSRGRRIDLLVADVILKASNGPAVAREVRHLQPAMRVLFISGFSLSELDRRHLLHPDEIVPNRVEFLQKPFSGDDFLQSVGKLLAS